MKSWRISTSRGVVLKHSAAAAVALSLVLTMGSVAAHAAGSPKKAGRSIAVSVPPDPVSIKPGHTTRVQLRVVNPGSKAVHIKIEGRSITLGDEGKVRINEGPDPLWDKRVDFPSKPFKVPALSYKNLSVRVRVPHSLQPDLYFLGFVVTPIPNSSSGVTVINQIGGFFTIDIAGPRDRRLTADLELPGWSLLGLHVYVGTELDGTLHVHNIGHAAVRFWGETDTTATGGSPGQVRIPISLVPTLRERTFTVVGKRAWPIGFLRTEVRITYPSTTETKTSEILFTRSDLVINPLVFVVLGILLAILVWRRVMARRRKAGIAPKASQPRGRFAFRRGS